MIVFLAALASTAAMSDYRTELASKEYQFVTGDTRRLNVSADVYNHPNLNAKKKKLSLRLIPELKPVEMNKDGKRLIAFIPQDNGLASIIDRVKRENGLGSKKAKS